MVQLTLTTGTAPQKEEILVPIFIYEDGVEAKQLAKLIVDVKPSYLLNCSNSVESLKEYVNSGRVNRNICYIMDSKAVASIGKELLAKIKVINLFKCN